MAFMRKQYEAAFKAKVALEAVKGEKTIAQIASAYKVHPNQIRQWRLRLLPQELPLEFEEHPQHLGDGKDDLAMRDIPLLK